jgi:hypothetical protein
MHPVVIMAYDKSPAINKAVAALEEAGMEVRVLNTAHAKLAEFLGALAGEDDEEDTPEEPKDEPKADEEPKEQKDDAPVEELPVEEEPVVATESLKAIVDGEEIVVQLTEGPSELYPNGLMVGSKTAYMVNESHFAFWPASEGDGLYDLTHQVQVQFGDKAVYENVVIKPAGDWPLLKLNKDVYAKFQEAK